MNLAVTFKASDQSFKLGFGEVVQMTDGGYERGYAAGFAEGVASVPDYANALITNALTQYTNEKATTIRANAFMGCTMLVSINIPNVKTLGASCFQGCENLKIVNAPSVQTINSKSFSQCYDLERLEFPNLTTFNQGDNFSYCSKLKYVDLGNVSKLNSWTFTSCTSLQVVIIRKANGVCNLSTTNAISGSGVGSGIGYIYVPKSLIDAYKTATNWKTYASQIRAIEDYPDICGK